MLGETKPSTRIEFFVDFVRPHCVLIEAAVTALERDYAAPSSTSGRS